MRLLIVAWDFPPDPSPQAIRWAYLARELALAGHEVHVLAPDLAARGPGGLPGMPASVIVHRVFPGPLIGFIVSRQRKRSAVPTGEAVGDAAAPVGEFHRKRRQRDEVGTHGNHRVSHGLNWKGRLAEGIKGIESWILFPDSRSEWLPWARKQLDAVLDDVRPDAVITSHEPANTLQLGLRARQRGYRWVADLGDPVLAPYTPRRWRRRARKLEEATCERADLVTVTCESTRRLLAQRHGLPLARCLVLTQGFDASFEESTLQVPAFDPECLELLYTGRFYSFRRIDALLQAIAEVPGVRLSIAAVNLPTAVVDAAAVNPAQIRLLGFVSHSHALALQRKCDVLVNIANDDAVQVPGKIYEYLGAGTPVLQVGHSDEDAGSQLVREAGLGWFERNETNALAMRLRALRAEKIRTGCLARPAATGYDIAKHSWHHLASTLAHAIAAMLQEEHAESDTTTTPRIASRGH